MIAVIYVAGCASPEVQKQDEVLLGNLQKLQERPAVTEIAWRQPKERVRGVAERVGLVLQTDFLADEELRAAITYSREHAGRGFLAWHDGQLVAADFTDGVDAHTQFASYSMHKSVLAIVVLAAIEDGLIESLDDPIGRYLQAWHADVRGTITIRQLLTHSSGLAHYAFDSKEAAGINYSSRIRAQALAYPLAGKPGEIFQYNNVNSLIVGIALEDVLTKRGRRYADYLSERIWQPLQNQDAALWLSHADGISRYQAGLEAGLADWLNIGIMLANGGKFAGSTILLPASVAELTMPSATNPSYGLHIWLGNAWQPERSYGPGTPVKVPHKDPYLAADVWFFDGFGGQRVYVVPSRKLVLARFGEVDLSYDDSAIVNMSLRGLIRAEADLAGETYNTPEADVVYQERFRIIAQQAQLGNGLDAYDPLVTLPGAPNHEPLVLKNADWLDQATREQLEAIANSTNTQGLQVWHRGALRYSYFADGVEDSTPIISRSLSKPLSVVAVGRAIQRGYIDSLDQAVADFIHEWRGTPKAEITIRQLLQMRSGLAPQGFSLDPNDVMSRAYLHPFHTEAIIAEYPLVTRPGSRYDYSNANAELVAPVIERATGRRYEQWLSQEVLRPLDAPGGQTWVNRPGGTAHSGCCSLLPTETWLRLSVLLLNDGVWEGRILLPETFVTEMTTPTEQYEHAAMGVYVAGDFVEYRGHANPDVKYRKSFHSEPYLADDLFLFDGNGNQVSYIMPSQDLVVLRVGVAPPKGVTWDNSALPNLVLRALQRNAGVALKPQPH